MKLLHKDLLLEYGFRENKAKSTDQIEVMTRNKLDIRIKNGTLFFYSNMGIDYPLKDFSALRKLYKEIKNEELKL